MKWKLIGLLCFMMTPQASNAQYQVEHFDGAFNSPHWRTTPSGPLWVPDGVSGQAIRITDCAFSSATSHCAKASSTAKGVQCLP
jgi:hypothetical protein